MTTPIFSVIVPFYNRSKYLKSVIETIGKQTFEDWELIIVDDGSTDDLSVRFTEFFIDKRIKYIYQTNRGVSAARNKGVEASQGHYLIFLDSDDDVTPNWLGDFFDESQSGVIDMVSCGALVIQREGKSKELKPKALGLLYNNIQFNFYAGTYALKRTLFEEIGGFDDRLVFGENYDLGVRASHFARSWKLVNAFNLTYHKTAKASANYYRGRIASKLYMVKKYSNHSFLTRECVDEFRKSTMLSVAIDYARIGEKIQAVKMIARVIAFQPLWLKAYIRIPLVLLGRYQIK